jgi:hypothetical protein
MVSKLITNELDILFVIDNSASTADKQTLFSQNFAQLVAALDAFPGGRPSLHIGVVSTTVGTGSDIDFGTECPKVAPSDDGLLQNTARISGCGAPNGRFLSDLPNASGRSVNYTGTLANAFSCVATLGTTGCGFEAPLESMKRALDGSRPENAGFIRPEADLAVVVLTDEDDCSVKDPAIFSLNNVGPGDFRCQPLFAYTCDQMITATGAGNYTGCKATTGSYLQDTGAYVSFLESIKDPSQLIVATIAGADSMGTMPAPTGFSIATGPITQPFTQSLALLPSCSTTINGASAIGRPGLRIADFVSRFTLRGQFYSVCQSDYSQALVDIGQRLFAAMGPCIEGDIDATDSDASNPGVQPRCTVTDIENYGQASQTEAQLPACQMTAPGQPADGARPCWWVQNDATTCPSATTTPTHLLLHVERSAPPPIDTFTKISCPHAP